jgi:hypothetical protein
MVRDAVPNCVTSQTMTKGFQQSQMGREQLTNGANFTEIEINTNIINQKWNKLGMLIGFSYAFFPGLNILLAEIFR